MDNEQPNSDTKRNVWNIWNGFSFSNNLEWGFVFIIFTKDTITIAFEFIQSIIATPTTPIIIIIIFSILWIVNAHSARKMSFEMETMVNGDRLTMINFISIF